MSDASPARPLQGDAALIRAVGTFALTAAVINVIIGGGIFRMPSALATQMGSAAPLALLAGALAIVPVALCFAAIGSRAQATGGPYTYLTAVFGPFAGFLAGALMWISNIASSAGVAAALSVQVATLVPAFADPYARAGLLTVVYLLLFALNAFGVKLGARAIAVLATLKLLPLFLLAAIGVWFVDWSRVSFAFGDVPSVSALGASMVLVMFAYSGMETALVPSGELRDPARNVPRATIAAILLVVLLYLGLQIVGQGLLGDALAKSGVPIADTAAALWAPGRTLLLVTACISMTGFLLGNLFGTSRLVFALGRDGYLPRAFGRVTATHRVPLLALAVHAGLAWVLALGGTFDTLALISGGAICLMYGMVSLAAWRAQRIDLRHGDAVPFRLPGGPAIPLVSFVAMLAIVTTLKADEWAAIGIALGALVVVYVGLRHSSAMSSVSNPTIKILVSLNKNGDMALEEISELLPKRFKDHRDFYPLASLIQQGFVEDSFSGYIESSEATRNLASKTQLISWQLYAWSTADSMATYKGHTWSLYGGKESLRSQRYALTGSGYLHLEELRVRRNDRAFAVFLAVLSAIIASYFTTLFGQ